MGMKALQCGIGTALSQRAIRRIFFLIILTIAASAFMFSVSQAQSSTGCDGYGDPYGSPGVPYGSPGTPGSTGCDAYSLPDLTITNVTVPDVVGKGTLVDISWAVTNVGGSTAASPYGCTTASTDGSSNYYDSCWWDTVYLSMDDQFDPMSDSQLTSKIVTAPLDAGDSYTANMSTYIANIPNGHYYLIFMTDGWGSINESNNDNNAFVSQQITVQGDDPDLTITSATAPATLAKEEIADMSLTVKNLGPGAAVTNWGIMDGVFFSTDDQLDTSVDKFIGISSTPGPVAPGDSYTVNISPNINNIPSGDGYLIFVTDLSCGMGGCGTNGRILETNENNNVFVLPATVTGADPDLVPVSLDTPDTAGPGDQISASWTVYNEGAGNAFSENEYPWIDELFFSTDDQLDSSDTYLSYGYPNHLYMGSSVSFPPGEGYSLSNTLSPWDPGIPDVAPGTYYLILKTDKWDDIYESNEENNVLVKPITITERKYPDLTVTSIDAPDSVNAGDDMLSASYTVYNQGEGTATGGFFMSGWSDNVVLSTDTTWDSGDIFVSQPWYSGSLAAGASYELIFGANTGSLSPGTYYLLVKADNYNDVNESDETNNIAVHEFTVTAPEPTDLVPTALDIPDSIEAGSSLTASWTVYNQGSQTAIGSWCSGCWRDELFLSADDQLDGSDTFLTDNWNIHPVDPGAGYTLSSAATIPIVPAGNYYLIIKTDANGYVPETDEENNVLARPITITASTAPVISNVVVTPTCTGASVTWNTDEPADSFVSVWNSSGQYFFGDATVTTTHSINVVGLESGQSYDYIIMSTDAAWNSSGFFSGFTVPGGKPVLGLTGLSVYWASYADYDLRQLSVKYDLANEGDSMAYAVAFTGSSATAGVTLTSSATMALDDLAPGATVQVPVKYYVPEGVEKFRADNTFSAEDECGNPYIYP